MILVCSASPVHGADRQSVEELYIKSGLARQLESVGPALWAGYSEYFRSSGGHSGREKKVYREVERLLAESFDVRRMRETLVAGLMLDIPDRDMERILAWLNSPVGRKITALEEHASSGEGMRQALEYIRSIERKSVPDSRRRLVERLDRAMDITATTVDVTLAMQFALALTMDGVGRNMSEDQVAERFENFRQNRNGQVPVTTRRQVLGTLLYTYQSLSDEELAGYLDFIGSESGQVYSRVTSKHLLQALNNASFEFARRVSVL